MPELFRGQGGQDIATTLSPGGTSDFGRLRGADFRSEGGAATKGIRFMALTIATLARLIIGAGAAVAMLQAAPALVSAQDQESAAPVEATPAPAPTPSRASARSRATASVATATATLASIRVTRELDVPHWLEPGQYVWNDDGAPAAGPTIVVVNIRARVLSVYRAGVEIGRSSLIYGADNKPTPLGTFPILEKDADHRSNLYDAPMPHMLRLTWDGVAVHGSPTLEAALATRGCVGLPVEFAELLYGAVRVGDRVVIWDGVTTA